MREQEENLVSYIEDQIGSELMASEKKTIPSKSEVDGDTNTCYDRRKILRDYNILFLCYYNYNYNYEAIKGQGTKRVKQNLLCTLIIIVYVLYDFYEIKHSVSQ